MTHNGSHFVIHTIDPVKDILETINITPERPQTPYLARLTAQACAAKAISTQKSPTNSFMNLEAAAQTNKLIELFTKASSR